MALSNGRSIANALKTFFAENNRYPDLEEFRALVTGKAAKTKKAPEQDETEEKST